MLLFLLACAEAPEWKTTMQPVARCGNGVVDDGEACDAGDLNSNINADACRSDCRLPMCGDYVQDQAEGCDDGNHVGGDGCTPSCQVEGGLLEQEPNNDQASAQSNTGAVAGQLTAGDVDCWQVVVDSCESVQVQQQAPCAADLLLALYSPEGNWMASGGPGLEGCAVLDPLEQPGARYLQAGDWTVCVSSVIDAPVDGYQLTLSAITDASLPMGADLDLDGAPDSCDLDRDGDGVADIDDNCPDLSNGPETDALSLDASGYVTTWLSAGPFTGDESSSCRPAEVSRVGEDVPLSVSFGDAAGDVFWEAHLFDSALFDFLPYYGDVSAPREAYALVYLWSDTARTATLAVGADDGVFGYWNGLRVLDIESCQGVNWDQFQAPVDIVMGWNTLLLKVRDQGGGWGLSARLLDENGQGITDLQPALDPLGLWLPDQSDSDGDGVGDACEEF